MNNVNKYLDAIVLAAIGLLLINSLSGYFSAGYVLTINFYVGTLCWIVAILLKVFKHKLARLCVILLLALSAFNIISFTIFNIALGSSEIYNYNGVYYILLSPNPIFLAALVIYALIGKVNSTTFYNKMVHASSIEIQEEYQKEAKFYYEKFRNSTNEEFDYAVKNIKDYPKPAQDAISIIISQKEDAKGEGEIL